MDGRTIAIVKALDPTGLDILLTLLRAPATERRIIEALEVGQPTVNRHLTQLAKALEATQLTWRPCTSAS
jgi:DNA-binding MarR family transcriptional regulator